MTREEAIEKLSEEELDLLNSDSEILAEFMAKFPEGQGVMGAVGSAIDSLLPDRKTLEAPLKASEVIGTQVAAGGAGIGDVVTGKGFPQSAETVRRVQAGQKPETKSGRVGEFIGSFFTPNQIALQGVTGGLLNPAVKKGAASAATGIGKLIARESDVAIPVAEKGAAEVIGALTGAPPEALQQVMLNKEAVVKAASFPELAEQVAGSMNKLSEHIGKLDDAANAFLRTEITDSTKPVLDAISKVRLDLGEAALPEIIEVKKTLDALTQQLAGKGGMISEAALAKWVKNLQSGINWSDPTGTVRNKALSKVQGLANEYLKALNPRYGQAEASLSEAIGLKDRVAQAMGLVKEAGQKAWSAKDVAVTKLKGLLSPENKAMTVSLMEEMSKIPGVPNFLQAAKETAAKSALAEPATGAHRLFGLGTRLPALGGVMAGLVKPAARATESTLGFGVNAAPAAVNAFNQGLQKRSY